MSFTVERLPVRAGLGRHVRHDSRSLAFALPVLPKTAIASQHWQRRVPIFDQGQLGSCTGNAAAGWVATDGATRQGLTAVSGQPVDEKLAVSIYSDATKLDSDPQNYPPTDTGSDGLSVAKVLQARGLAGPYLHAFAAAAVYSALQSGPGLLGITWYESMFDTDASGHIKIDATSGVAGGHEIIVPRIDVANGAVERVWIDNSWGSSWGVGGSGYFTAAEFASLLAQDGDFIQLAAVVPAPPTPTPTPVPTPSPVPTPADADAQLWNRIKPWVLGRHSGATRLVATQLLTWAKDKGYA